MFNFFRRKRKNDFDPTDPFVVRADTVGGFLDKKLEKFTLDQDVGTESAMVSSEKTKYLGVTVTSKKIKIFQYPLNELKKILKNYYKTDINFNISNYLSNIKFLKKINKRNKLIFFTTRNNYQNKRNLISDTRAFLESYGFKNQSYFTNKDGPKGEIILNTIKKLPKQKILIIEDSLIHIIRMEKILKENEINDYKFIIINYPWNITKDSRKRYNSCNEAYNEDKIDKHIKKLEENNRIIRVNKLYELKL